MNKKPTLKKEKFFGQVRTYILVHSTLPRNKQPINIAVAKKLPNKF